MFPNNSGLTITNWHYGYFWGVAGGGGGGKGRIVPVTSAGLNKILVSGKGIIIA